MTFWLVAAAVLVLGLGAALRYDARDRARRQRLGQAAGAAGAVPQPDPEAALRYNPPHAG